VTNSFTSTGSGTNTIKVVFTPTNTPLVLSNGTIIYSSTVTAYATNGILAPTWVVTGGYVVTFGPQSDTYNVGVPYDSNTYSLWQLGTNQTAVTNFPVLPGVSSIVTTNIAGPYTGVNVEDIGSVYYFTFTNGTSTGSQVAGATNVYGNTNNLVIVTNNNGSLTFSNNVNTNISTNATGNSTSFPFVLNPTTGLSYTVFMTNDNGVPTLLLGAVGYSLGSNTPAPLVFDAADNLYYQLLATNDNGVLTLQLSTNGY
jgi:hypothetical protein